MIVMVTGKNRVVPFEVNGVQESMMRAFLAVHATTKKTTGRDHCPALSISDDMPECGGGDIGATDGVEVAASDDDDGGDDDGEPARRSPHAKHHPSFTPALLSFTPLSHYTSLGRSRIYQLIADPVLRFPPPIKIGKSSRWLKTEVDSWLAKQADSRQQVAG